VELRHYRHVLALADHASFRKASEALGITQPALTKSLFQAQYQRSRHRVPFGPPSGNFPENGAREPILSRATPLVLRASRRELS
jgi:hypothetical protein